MEDQIPLQWTREVLVGGRVNMSTRKKNQLEHLGKTDSALAVACRSKKNRRLWHPVSWMTFVRIPALPLPWHLTGQVPSRGS